MRATRFIQEAGEQHDADNENKTDAQTRRLSAPALGRLLQFIDIPEFHIFLTPHHHNSNLIIRHGHYGCSIIDWRSEAETKGRILTFVVFL
ncbi:hypothetical protein [Propionivibrio sp.]|uniref:hypothetical protein n=1 Tax=Propionivibrio sp. TaxID=2212460 RepID=UPI0025FA59BD|nr:hypothetical protein [Propionivibrio sp.]